MLRNKNKGNTGKYPQEKTVTILGWMANEPKMLFRFFALSGLQANMLRHAINDPGFLAGLLDFLMSHERDLMAFCSATGKSPKRLHHHGSLLEQ